MSATEADHCRELGMGEQKIAERGRRFREMQSETDIEILKALIEFPLHGAAIEGRIFDHTREEELAGINDND